MARIVVAVVRGGELDGSFATLTGVVDLAWDVETFAARVKESRGAYLAGIEPWQMTVFGPWTRRPRSAEWTARLADVDGALDPADVLEPLLVGMERAFFLVRITTPPVAAGESVALAWHAWSVPTILVV